MDNEDPIFDSENTFQRMRSEIVESLQTAQCNLGKLRTLIVDEETEILRFFVDVDCNPSRVSNPEALRRCNQLLDILAFFNEGLGILVTTVGCVCLDGTQVRDHFHSPSAPLPSSSNNHGLLNPESDPVFRALRETEGQQHNAVRLSYLDSNDHTAVRGKIKSVRPQDVNSTNASSSQGGIDNVDPAMLEPSPFFTGTLLECTLSHPISPSDFWVHPNSSVANDDVAKLLSEGELSAKPPIPACDLKPGLYCTAPDQLVDKNVYYRAQILKVACNSQVALGKQYAKVIFMDYGNTRWVPADLLRKFHVDSENYLPTCPRQARHCCLEGVKPRNGVSWTKDEIKAFTNLLCELSDDGQLDSKDLEATVTKSMENIVSLVSVRTTFEDPLDSNGEVFGDVGRRMVTQGFALDSAEGSFYPIEDLRADDSPPDSEVEE